MVYYGFMHIKVKRKLGSQAIQRSSNESSVWPSNDLKQPQNSKFLTMASCISNESQEQHYFRTHCILLRYRPRQLGLHGYGYCLSSITVSLHMSCYLCDVPRKGALGYQEGWLPGNTCVFGGVMIDRQKSLTCLLHISSPQRPYTVPWRRPDSRGC